MGLDGFKKIGYDKRNQPPNTLRRATENADNEEIASFILQFL